MVDNDGMIEENSLAGSLYADDLCLVENSKQDVQMVFACIGGCISEYGMNEQKSMVDVVCIREKQRKKIKY